MPTHDVIDLSPETDEAEEMVEVPVEEIGELLDLIEDLELSLTQSGYTENAASLIGEIQGILMQYVEAEGEEDETASD